MKQKAWLCLVLVFIMLTGCSAQKSALDTGGYVVRQDTPYHATVSFNTMLAVEKFEAAHGLLTTANAEEVTADDLAAIHETVRLQEMKVIRAEAGPEDGDLAVVAVLRANKFAGVQGEVVLFGVEILRKIDNKWYVSRHMDEFSQNEIKRLLKISVPFQEELLANSDFFSNLNTEQRDSVQKQIVGMIDNNKLILAEYEALEKQAREKYGIPEPEEEQ